MELYRTHLVISNRFADEICKLCEHKNINIVLKDEPSFQYFERPNVSEDVGPYGRTIQNRKCHNKDDRSLPKNSIQCKEILIKSENKLDVENFVSLLIGAQTILNCANTDMLRSDSRPVQINVDVVGYGIDFDDDMFTDEVFAQRFSYIDRALSCFKIATAAWGDYKAINAIEKLHLSFEILCCTVNSLEPHHGKIFDEDKYNNNYYAHAAYAINTAFSVIEELKLKIRSSTKKKRFTPDEKEWNPAVLSCINKRLELIGISQEDRIEWIIRGDPTKLDSSLTPVFGTKSTWSKYEDVNDISLTFPEALHYCSRLRNFHTAHHFDNLDSGLSPYLVFNVQQVARQILLKYLHVWDDIKYN